VGELTGIAVEPDGSGFVLRAAPRHGVTHASDVGSSSRARAASCRAVYAVKRRAAFALAALLIPATPRRRAAERAVLADLRPPATERAARTRLHRSRPPVHGHCRCRRHRFARASPRRAPPELESPWRASRRLPAATRLERDVDLRRHAPRRHRERGRDGPCRARFLSSFVLEIVPGRRVRFLDEAFRVPARAVAAKGCC
jgi:hypothetical protein